jgi:hypothetical protein
LPGRSSAHSNVTSEVEENPNVTVEALVVPVGPLSIRSA